jgi:hypothetical protein
MTNRIIFPENFDWKAYGRELRGTSVIYLGSSPKYSHNPKCPLTGDSCMNLLEGHHSCGCKDYPKRDYLTFFIIVFVLFFEVGSLFG